MEWPEPDPLYQDSLSDAHWWRGQDEREGQDEGGVDGYEITGGVPKAYGHAGSVKVLSVHVSTSGYRDGGSERHYRLVMQVPPSWQHALTYSDVSTVVRNWRGPI